MPEAAFIPAVPLPHHPTKTLLSRCPPKRNRSPQSTPQCNIPLRIPLLPLPPPLSHTLLPAITLNATLYLATFRTRQKLLTGPALIHAACLGSLLWTTLSWQGYMLCFSFLIFGSLFTRIGREKKERLGIAEARGGARGIANLWGAAGVPAICAVCACIADIFFLKRYVYIGATVSSCMRVAYVAALAAKFADTTSSEIGKAFGSTTYLPINMKMVPNGTEGAVSVEGSVAGISAAVVTAVAGLALRLLPMEWTCVVVVVVAATVANVAESFIGCYQKEIGWSNEFVNFVNTAISALIAACAWALVLVLGQ